MSAENNYFTAAAFIAATVEVYETMHHTAISRGSALPSHDHNAVEVYETMRHTATSWGFVLPTYADRNSYQP